jgi:hypothetical protein
MLKIHSGCDEHDKYKRLGALAAAGNLARLESAELHAHLRRCEQCNEVFRQYLALTTQGVAILADEFAERLGQASWDKDAAFEQLLERIERAQHTPPEKNRRTSKPVPAGKLLRSPVRSIAAILLAAGLILTVVLGSYHLGLRTHSQSVSNVTAAPIRIDDRLQRISEEKQQADEALAQQTERLAQLQADGAQRTRKIAFNASCFRGPSEQAPGSEQPVRGSITGVVAGTRFTYHPTANPQPIVRGGQDRAGQPASGARQDCRSHHLPGGKNYRTDLG